MPAPARWIPERPAALRPGRADGGERRGDELDQVALEEVAVRLGGRRGSGRGPGRAGCRAAGGPAAEEDGTEEDQERRRRRRASTRARHRVVPAPQRRRRETPRAPRPRGRAAGPPGSSRSSGRQSSKGRGDRFPLAMFRVAYQIFRFRGLLATLTSRELKARYRGSVLGFLWSLANPLLLLAVYSFVFSVVFKPARRRRHEPYALFLVSGLFPWIWLSASPLEGSMSLVANSGLIRKAVFPAELLPMVVGARRTWSTCCSRCRSSSRPCWPGGSSATRWAASSVVAAAGGASCSSCRWSPAWRSALRRSPSISRTSATCWPTCSPCCSSSPPSSISLDSIRGHVPVLVGGAAQPLHAVHPRLPGRALPRPLPRPLLWMQMAAGEPGRLGARGRGCSTGCARRWWRRHDRGQPETAPNGRPSPAVRREAIRVEGVSKLYRRTLPGDRLRTLKSALVERQPDPRPAARGGDRGALEAVDFDGRAAARPSG